MHFETDLSNFYGIYFEKLMSVLGTHILALGQMHSNRLLSDYIGVWLGHGWHGNFNESLFDVRFFCLVEYKKYPYAFSDTCSNSTVIFL